MERLACVKLPFLAMQIALKANPEWRNFPTVLLDRDHPRGRILEANKHARRLKIEPGMRYAGALSLCSDPADSAFSNNLRAAIYCPDEYQQVREELREQLGDFSPHLDALSDFSMRFSFLATDSAKAERGEALGRTTAFWLQATGLDRLYGSFEAWAAKLEAALKEEEFFASVVVGFSRFGTYALAHTQGVGVRVLESKAQEKHMLRSLSLARLDLDPRLKESLLQLGIRTVGEFLDLPASGIARRFGKEARQFYDFASTRNDLPIRRTSEDAPIERTLLFDQGEFNTERLIFRIKFELHAMAQKLAGRALVLLQLEMNFYRDEELEFCEIVRPARPSLDESTMIELVRLRLEIIEFSRTPTRLHLLAVGVPDKSEQTRLLSARNDRRWDDAQHALARLRAEFGPLCVLGFKAQNTHLPEDRFALKPLQTLARPSASLSLVTANLAAKDDAPNSSTSLVRRILADPEPIARAVAMQNQGSEAPYILSGHWWTQEAVHREYYYLDTHSGELLWVFYDRLRRGWYLHGRVE
ncbi:Y-family DNA polymerase [Bradymonas sediminis]|uniref:Uncharacterized protein n=1 Tax=Bradymonas sediminis TaxID=1548548 RepID=A0A2Z4FMG3_9DELT|nr:DNA polymerase Y family protein [Bradymonas sediminis]AWV90177.1 hypothetical protein DN745_12875 [Bradymonas sediminis]TDP75855.1 protein ImuB [Bradymonas sediminis]